MSAPDVPILARRSARSPQRGQRSIRLVVVLSLVALTELVAVIGLLAAGGLERSVGAITNVIGYPDPRPDTVRVGSGAERVAIDVLANDRDRDGDPLVLRRVDGVDGGRFSIDGAQLRFTPEPGFHGTVVAGYTVSDGSWEVEGTVTVEVVPDAAPLAVPDAVVGSGKAVAIEPLENDHDPEGGPVRLVAVGPAAHGVVELDGGVVRYAPPADFSGIDRFTYVIEDDLGATSTASVAVSVPAPTCTGEARDDIDEDGDRYDNAAEAASATDPCNPGSMPPDADADAVPDANDPFHLDAGNGFATSMPVSLTFDALLAGTVAETGFTGVMANGQAPDEHLDPGRISIQGGTLRILSSPSGDAYREENAQRNALQLGVRVPNTTFTVAARLRGPFPSHTMQSAAIYVGTGDQDHYLKLAVSAVDGAGGIKVTYEDGGDGRGAALHEDPAVLTAEYVDLFITVDPATWETRSSYAVAGGDRVGLGDSARLSLPGGAAEVVAVGVMVTPELGGPAYAGTWDWLTVEATGP